MTPRRKWILAAVVAVVLAVPAGTWLYINVIRDEAPERLSLETVAGESPATTGAGSATTAAGGGGAMSGTVDGTWKVATGTQVGYRVKEILFGQNAEAVGRTSEVTGTLEIEGTTVSAVELSVAMASVTSDSDRRDGQFRGRIMEVDRFPTATFELTKPFELPSVPADESPITVRATGDLTLHGVTKPVTVELEARRTGSSIAVSGAIPIVFADYDIDNPSGGPAQTEDRGELELLVVFAKA